MTNEDKKVIVQSVKNAQLFLQTAESRKPTREFISNTVGMESTSSIFTSEKHVSHIEEDDDLFNDVSSVGSSSHEDDISATSNANVSGFSGDQVTWWDLSKAVFMYQIFVQRYDYNFVFQRKMRHIDLATISFDVEHRSNFIKKGKNKY